MITGIRDLDRKILEYVDEDDYAALLFTCKYISGLFDEIFFRNKLVNKFNFFRKTDAKRYYNIISRFNQIHVLISSNQKVGIQCENCDMILKEKGIINWAISSIQYSEERDEVSLCLGMGYDTVLLTTHVNFLTNRFTCRKEPDYIFELVDIKIDSKPFYDWSDRKNYTMFLFLKND